MKYNSLNCCASLFESLNYCSPYKSADVTNVTKSVLILLCHNVIVNITSPMLFFIFYFIFMDNDLTFFHLTWLSRK